MRDITVDRHVLTVPTITACRYRTIWMSDFHLGTRGCKAKQLLDFLAQSTADRIYLVGDIVDLWRLRADGYWPRAHGDVVAHLIGLARAGTEVLYLPGNHDDALRDRIGARFGQVAVVGNLIHTTADGRRFLVMHGDDLDLVSRYATWFSHAGARLYAGVQQLNLSLNAALFKGRSSRPLVSGFLKHAVKRGFNNLGRYETRLVREVRRLGVDGIICGHVHRAELREIDGITYANSGDWVESCTALVEHHDGTLAIVERVS